MVTHVLGLTNASAKSALQQYVKEETGTSHLEIFYNMASLKNTFIGTILNRLTYCSECEAIKRENEKIQGIIRSLSLFPKSTNLSADKAADVLPYLSDKQIGLLNFDQIRGIKKKLSYDEFCIFLQRAALGEESRLIWEILGTIDQYAATSLKNLLEQIWFNNYLIKNPKAFEVLLQSISIKTLNDGQVKLLLEDILSQNYVCDCSDKKYFSALERIRSGASFKEAVRDVAILREPKEKNKSAVIIIIGNKRMLSDREKLVQKSAFFKNFLQDQGEIKLEGIKSSIFRQLNHFILTGEIEVDKSNFLELLDAMNFLGIDDLAKKAEEFLMFEIDGVLVETLLYYSEKYNLLNLRNACEERLIQSQRAANFELLSESFKHELEIADHHKLAKYINESLFSFVKTPFNIWLKSTTKHFDEIVNYCELVEYFENDQFDFFKSLFLVNLEKIVIKDHFLVNFWHEAEKGKKGSNMLKIICFEFVRRNPICTIQLFDNLVPDELQTPLNEGLFPLW